MYVAIRDCAVYQAGWTTLQEGLAALDLDAVEVAVGRDMAIPDPARPEDEASLPIDTAESAVATRAAYEALGIQIDALFVANNFNAQRLEEEIHWVAASLRAADTLGAKVVRIDAAMTGQQSLPRDRRVAIYTEACQRALAAAENPTVPLGIENHGSQGNDPQWLKAVLDSLDEKQVGIALDPANLYWEGQALSRVYELVGELAPRVVHVHCKNLSLPGTQGTGGHRQFWQYAKAVKPLYEGDINQRRIVETLAAAGYCSGLTIEEEVLAQFDQPARQEVLRKDVETLSKLVRDDGI